ncbi:MAG TPA: hypothetical protein DEP87_01225 [Candidatus Pacebacteria bacterium]|nr:hypothetical protein [Candidatus Paceibacterota bacterium]
MITLDTLAIVTQDFDQTKIVNSEAADLYREYSNVINKFKTELKFDIAALKVIMEIEKQLLNLDASSSIPKEIKAALDILKARSSQTVTSTASPLDFTMQHYSDGDGGVGSIL